MHAPVTLLYGGLCGALLVALGLYISLLRLIHKAYVGQLPQALIRPVRAHGNAAEWTAIAMLLLLLLELSGVGSLTLHVLGGSFLLGRLLNAYGTLGRSRWAGTAAATFNYASILALSVSALQLHFAR